MSKRILLKMALLSLLLIGCGQGGDEKLATMKMVTTVERFLLY